jgi:hypothetical protein
MYRTATPASIPSGSGCSCGNGNGLGCSCKGLGQTATDSDISTIGGDFGSFLSDLFTNSDGSLNLPAVGFAALAAYLLFFNKKRR